MQNSIFMKVLVVGIIGLFVGASISSGFDITSTDNSQPLSRGWLYVGGSGPGNYTTIQSAIDDANSGDTIYVYNGIYSECISIGSKSITIIGQNKDATIIDGENVPNNFTAVDLGLYSGLDFSRFTIKNFWYGFDIHSLNIVNIHHNKIISNKYGININFLGYYNPSSIYNNQIIDNYCYGISLHSNTNNVSVYNNIISYNNYGNLNLNAGASYNYFYNNIISGAAGGFLKVGRFPQCPMFLFVPLSSLSKRPRQKLLGKEHLDFFTEGENLFAREISAGQE